MPLFLYDFIFHIFYLISSKPELFVLRHIRLSFILHLCLGFPPDSGIAVHNAGAGDRVVSKFHTDSVQGGIQLLALFFFGTVLKQRHLFEPILRKSCEGHTDQPQWLSLPELLEQLSGICVDLIGDIYGISKLHLVGTVLKIQGSESNGNAGTFLPLPSHSGGDHIALLQQNQLDLVPEIELSSNDLLIDLASIGLGIAFVPDFCVSHTSGDLFQIPLKNELPGRQLAIIHSEQMPVSNAARQFMSYF